MTRMGTDFFNAGRRRRREDSSPGNCVGEGLGVNFLHSFGCCFAERCARVVEKRGEGGHSRACSFSAGAESFRDHHSDRWAWVLQRVCQGRQREVEAGVKGSECGHCDHRKRIVFGRQALDQGWNGGCRVCAHHYQLGNCLDPSCGGCLRIGVDIVGEQGRECGDAFRTQCGQCLEYVLGSSGAFDATGAGEEGRRCGTGIWPKEFKALQCAHGAEFGSIRGGRDRKPSLEAKRGGGWRESM